MKTAKGFLKRNFIILAVAAVLTLTAVSVAVVNGTLDTAHTYVGAAIIPNVFGLTGFTGGNGFIWCSGTLVTPRVFLTAAHCLQPFGQPLTNYVSLDQVLVT